ncbi:plasmid partitioning/stability family protein [Enterobacter hormaechei]
MPQERRKVLLYLRPEISASERFVDARIELHPNRVRGDVARTALLAGFALAEIDSRLPGILAATLGDDTKGETIRAILGSFLELQPPSAVPVAKPADETPLSWDMRKENPDEPDNSSIKRFSSQFPE